MHELKHGWEDFRDASRLARRDLPRVCVVKLEKQLPVLVSMYDLGGSQGAQPWDLTKPAGFGSA